MPFSSEKQRRYLWAKHPDIARRWTRKYGSKPAGLKAQLKHERKRRRARRRRRRS